MFGKYVEGKYKLICRETPFDLDSWNDLKETAIDPLFLVDQNLSDSDAEVYTHFYSQAPNSSYSQNEAWANAAIDNISVFDNEKLPIYGYRQLAATFPFFDLDKAKDFDSLEFLKYNSARLYAWFHNNADFQSGSITLMTVPDDDDGSYPDIGEKLKYLQGDSGKIYFYIEAVKRRMTYGNRMTSTYTVTRGYEYGTSSVTIGGIRLDTPQVKPITMLGRKIMDAERDVVKKAE
jgi:hypothetical protein